MTCPLEHEAGHVPDFDPNDSTGFPATVAAGVPAKTKPNAARARAIATPEFGTVGQGFPRGLKGGLLEAVAQQVIEGGANVRQVTQLPNIIPYDSLQPVLTRGQQLWTRTQLPGGTPNGSNTTQPSNLGPSTLPNPLTGRSLHPAAIMEPLLAEVSGLLSNSPGNFTNPGKPPSFSLGEGIKVLTPTEGVPGDVYSPNVPQGSSNRIPAWMGGLFGAGAAGALWQAWAHLQRMQSISRTPFLHGSGSGSTGGRSKGGAFRTPTFRPNDFVKRPKLGDALNQYVDDTVTQGDSGEG